VAEGGGLLRSPVSFGRLVGVGYRMMVLGPRLGTLERPPVCAYRAHTASHTDTRSHTTDVTQSFDDLHATR